MTDAYTHPNGATVVRDDNGLCIDDSEQRIFLRTSSVDTLRDFLLHELGLWRDPETWLLVRVNSDGNGMYLVISPSDFGGIWWRAGDGEGDRYDRAVARYKATLVPPPREPKPGEMWRITVAGLQFNAVVKLGKTGIWFVTEQATVPAGGIPADKRRLLAEADGTAVSGE